MSAGSPPEDTRRRVARTRCRVAAVAARLPLWPTLTLLSVAVLVVQLPGPHATAWHFFDDAARLLVGDGPAGDATGLHLYRDRPDFQFGPLSIVAALPLALVGAGAWGAMIVSSVAGLVALALVLDAVERLRPGFRATVDPAALLVAGATAVVTWGDVAVRTAHIDDAIALVALAAALRWCALGRGWPVAVAVAVAAAAKPWAIVFAPLALLPPPVRSQARSAAGPGTGPRPAGDEGSGSASVGRLIGPLARFAAVGAFAALTWAPFVLVEPLTLDTSEFRISNDPTSVLRALGFDDPATPLWVRPAQLVGGTALVALLVARGRWPAAVLAGIAWRLLLDPGAHRYYTVGLVLGALFVELLARRGRVPWFTVAAAVTLEVTALPGVPVVPARTARLVCVVAALVAAVAVDLGGRPGAGQRARASRFRGSGARDGGEVELTYGGAHVRSQQRGRGECGG
jgi:hypothetical protein